MRKFLALFFAAAMFFVAACGDDDLSRDDARKELIDETGVSEEQADCILDLMDELDIDYGADEDDVPEDKQDEFLESASECANP